jgi:large subunit ribosomal protein L6
MRKPLSQKIEVPEGIEVSIDGNLVKIKGPEGELSREFNFGLLEIKKEGNEVIIGYEKSSKREKKTMNTIAAHIKNMIKGVQEKFVYELKIASSHFPMTAKQEGNKITIKNYYGEKVERVSRVPEGVEVEVKKDIIIVKSNNKELAGQAAANLENVTKVRNRDRRIFQDGVYITKKAGKAI